MEAPKLKAHRFDISRKCKESERILQMLLIEKRAEEKIKGILETKWR